MRTHQRNLYRYFLRHGDGCTVPLSRDFGVHPHEHLNAVRALEKMQLITVNRASTNYLLWKVRLTSTEIDEISHWN